MANLDSHKYRCLVTDYDNTLVDRGVLHPKIARAVNRLLDKNWIFSIATGRAFVYIRQTAKKLCLKHPLITQGGATIVDPLTGQTLLQHQIPPDQAKTLLEYLLQKDLIFAAETTQATYFHRFVPSLPPEPDHPHLKFRQKKEIHDSTLIKVIVQPNPGQALPSLHEDLTARFKNLHITKAVGLHGRLIFDITAATASKHLAVLEFARMLKLKPAHIIGVGDSYNDYPLLTACGYKVATKDAPGQLKAIADLVIPPAGQNGLLTLFSQLNTNH